MSQKAWDRVRAELNAPEEYCVSNDEKVKRLAALIKIVFEMASAYPARGSRPLKSLLVDGIDEETLWEQLQTRNNPLLKNIRKYLKTVSKRTLQFLPEESDCEVDENEDDITSADDSVVEEGSYDEVMDEEDEGIEDGDEDAELEENRDDDGDDDDESDEETDSYDEEEVKTPNKGTKKRIAGETAEGWDTDEELAMEAWLDATDELDTKRREKLENKEKRAKANTMNQWEDEEDDDEDDLDIVERAMYDDEEEEDDDDDEGMNPSTMRYEDFYVNELPKGKASANGKQSKKLVAINIDESSEEEDEEENFDMEDENDDYVESDEGEDDYGRSRQISQAMSSKKNSHLSVNKDSKNKSAEFTTNYQRRLLELGTQIQELEQELIAEKSWEMRGEVAAQHRPENSLLDVAVDVDRATKVAPVITQEYTSTVEDLIIKRIEDSKFDDPKPRNAMAEVLTTEPGDDKDPVELSQEKSKFGLAEIYAEDFAKKMLNSDEKLSVEVQALREEVVGLFGAASRHLDALCHFYFVPRPVAGETSAKVLATQRSLPALEIEDVAPYSVQSDAAKLAPEELLTKKKGPRIMLLSSEELGRDDRKKRRRVQKEFNRKEHRRADAQLDENVKRARREEEVLSKDKRVLVHASSQETKTKNHNETGEFSKSSMFFSNLQKDVEAGVKSQQQAQKSTKISAHNVTASASAYKL